MNLFKTLFSDKESNKEREIFIKKAEELIPYTKSIVIGSQLTILDKYPELRNASHLKYWDLFCTVSSTYSAQIRIGCFLKNKKLIEEIDSLIDKSLYEFDPNAISAKKNLEFFLVDMLSKNPDNKTPDLFRSIFGSWLVWNLTNKAPINKEMEISSVLSNLFHIGFVNYFDVNINTQ